MCPLQEIYRTCKNGMSSINHVLQEDRKFHFLSSGDRYILLRLVVDASMSDPVMLQHTLLKERRMSFYVLQQALSAVSPDKDYVLLVDFKG